MNEKNSGSVNGVLMAAVVGAAVGAGIALILAPCSGKETRAWMTQKGRDIKDRTANAFEQGKESMRRTATDLGRDAQAVATTLRG